MHRYRHVLKLPTITADDITEVMVWAVRLCRLVPGVRESLSTVVLGVWAALSVVLVGYTLGAHLTRLPAPAASDPALARGLRELFPATGAPPPGGAGGVPRDLLAVHVLYDRCGCSARVGKSLALRGVRPGAGVREVVLVVSDDVAATDRAATSRLEAAGFPVVTLATTEVADRLHVQAVPLLAIVDGTDRVLYAGGYTAGRDDPRLQDQRLIAEAEASRAPAALPIFGCATASALQKQLDPFGIKYGR
jgi:hypothetical protein